MLALDVLFGSHPVPDFLGIVAGHLYYFLTVLHPLATGKNLLKTPNWVYPLFSVKFNTMCSKIMSLDTWAHKLQNIIVAR